MKNLTMRLSDAGSPASNEGLIEDAARSLEPLVRRQAPTVDPSPSQALNVCMNEFEDPHPSLPRDRHSPISFRAGIHEVGRWLDFIVHEQISRSTRM